VRRSRRTETEDRVTPFHRIVAGAATAGLLLAASSLHAQPAPGSQPPPTAEPAAEPPPSTPPAEPAPAETTPTAAPVAGADASNTPDGEAAAPNRPDDWSMGIGAGYVFPAPASVLNPTLASVRFRFARGFTLEPLVDISTSKMRTQIGDVKTDNDQVDIMFAAHARLPVFSAGKVDFVLLGGAGIGYHKDAPDGDENDTTTENVFLDWGLGLDYWPKPRWCLSASATNPLVSLTRTRQEMLGDDRKDTSAAIGLVFDPVIYAMLHMFF
jgi:hypothetical protein